VDYVRLQDRGGIMVQKLIIQDGQQMLVDVSDNDAVMKTRRVAFDIQRTSDTLMVNLAVTHRMGQPVPDDSAILIVNGDEKTVALTDGTGTYSQACTDLDAFTLECEGQIEEVPAVTVITPEDRIAALEALVAQLMAGDA
jgi:hypothetical protein